MIGAPVTSWMLSKLTSISKSPLILSGFLASRRCSRVTQPFLAVQMVRTCRKSECGSALRTEFRQREEQLAHEVLSNLVPVPALQAKALRLSGHLTGRGSGEPEGTKKEASVPYMVNSASQTGSRVFLMISVLSLLSLISFPSPESKQILTKGSDFPVNIWISK